MKEKELVIKTPDNTSIYGKFTGRPDQPLFIVIHGLTGDMEEDLYVSATTWFQKQGFATFRFNLYGHQADARQLMNCTLKIHSSDLDAVVSHFVKEGFKKICIAGHSLGSLVIFGATKQMFSAVALWDPSYEISLTKATPDLPAGQYNKEADAYIMRWGTNILIGRAMAEEIDHYPWQSATKQLQAPLRLIVPGDGEIVGAKQYLVETKAENDLVIIKGASHYFSDTPEIREELFRVTKDWFSRYIKNEHML